MQAAFADLFRQHQRDKCPASLFVPACGGNKGIWGVGAASIHAKNCGRLRQLARAILLQKPGALCAPGHAHHAHGDGMTVGNGKGTACFNGVADGVPEV